MSMNQNIGLADRLIRLIVTIIFVVLGFVHSYYWFIPAAIILITAILGWCGLYTLLGINTGTVDKVVTKTAIKKSSVKKTVKKKKK